jgi:hypothetical protein
LLAATTSTLDAHASFFAVFFFGKTFPQPLNVTTKPHTETHTYKYL